MKSHLENLSLATLGGGCFWCVEAIFERLAGVREVISGYAGGETKNPTYQEVSAETTGHAEVCQIKFDSSEISYAELLKVFWRMHDPTTLNQQGHDVGTQYRSIILTHDEEQQGEAETSRTKAEKKRDRPIVTEIQPLELFYPAEEHHQDYFRNNPGVPYCAFVIQPKLDHLTTEGTATVN